jgi:hypothetical protein
MIEQLAVQIIFNTILCFAAIGVVEVIARWKHA